MATAPTDPAAVGATPTAVLPSRLYVGAQTAFQQQSYQARGSYGGNCGGLQSCTVTCTVASGLPWAVPVETVIDISQMFPPPLSIR